jgi:hypothetical protein
MKRAPSFLLLAPLICATALAQSSPFLDEKTERHLANEISGDRAFETLRIATQWHEPSQSEGFFAVARHVLALERRVRKKREREEWEKADAAERARTAPKKGRRSAEPSSEQEKLSPLWSSRP